MNLDPIKPYADLLKVIAIAVVALMLMMGGCSIGKGKSAKQVVALNKSIANKDRALLAAAESLRAGAAALDLVNLEAGRRVAEAKAAEEQAKVAGVVAANAKAAADKRQATFNDEIARARRNPTCAALLGADLRSVCGL